MTGRYGVLLSAAVEAVYPGLVCPERFESREDAEMFGQRVGVASPGMEFEVLEMVGSKWSPDPLSVIASRWGWVAS